MTRGTENKRGACGSTEEDNNISKRANIAAEESMPLEEPTASPQLSEKPTDTSNVTSLKELEEMLVNIQISISNILLDNRKTRNNLAELTTIVHEQKSEIARWSSTREKISSKFTESLRALTAISHKLKRKGNKPIIVKLASHKIKSNIYKARAKLKNIKVSNLFLNATGATHTVGNHIYLYEYLTSHGKKIVSRANELKKDRILLSVWSLDSKVYFKSSPEGRPIKINELEDIENV